MIAWLNENTPFPPVEQALGADSGACGLLAASRELSFTRLLNAYRLGIFPWCSDNQPVLWWNPDPRMVLYPAEFKISDSLRKTLRRTLRDDDWEIRIDADFTSVMQACANVRRKQQSGTWITAKIIAAYSTMHRAGYAHSVETWYRGEPVGGLYVIGVGSMIFGESMFARHSNASKIALAALVGQARRHGVEMIDCQQNTAHLATLGGREISRAKFLEHLNLATNGTPLPWRFDKTALQDALIPST